MRSFGVLFCCLMACGSAAAQSCEAVDGRSTYAISRDISGTRDFNERINATGWMFSLRHAEYGWDIRLYDSDGLDLTQLTPPTHGINPRQIYGWHFRNQDNNRVNKGEVNAPQELRLFSFDMALTGTGGFKPSPMTDDIAMDAQPGRGSLMIHDYGLADLDTGETARMVYLNFHACLSWPTTDKEYAQQAEAEAALAASRHISDELIEQVRSCGLSEDYEIEAYLTPVELGGDFDGDDVLDLAVPIRRVEDGKRGIAVCRAGTWLDVLGMEGALGDELLPEYFDHMDWWSLHAAGQAGQGAIDAPPPVLHGNGITIGISEKSSVLIWHDGEGFKSYWQGD